MPTMVCSKSHLGDLTFGPNMIDFGAVLFSKSFIHLLLHYCAQIFGDMDRQQ